VSCFWVKLDLNSRVTGCETQIMIWEVLKWSTERRSYYYEQRLSHYRMLYHMIHWKSRGLCSLTAVADVFNIPIWPNAQSLYFFLSSLERRMYNGFYSYTTCSFLAFGQQHGKWRNGWENYKEEKPSVLKLLKTVNDLCCVCFSALCLLQLSFSCHHCIVMEMEP